MIIRASCIALCVLLSATVAANKPAPAPATGKDPLLELTEDVYQLPGGVLTQFILSSYIGDVVLLKTDPAAPKSVKVVLGRTNCLTKGIKPPDVSLAALHLGSATVTRERALSLNILAYLGVNLADKQESKLTVTMTGRTQAGNDADLDWACFDKAVEDHFVKFPQDRGQVQFGLIRIAAVWTISHETFRKVDRWGDINGWGLVAKPKYLSQVTEMQTDYRVVADIVGDLGSIEPAGFDAAAMVIAPQQGAVLAYANDNELHPVVYRTDRVKNSASRLQSAGWFDHMYAWLGRGATVAKAPLRPAQPVRLRLAPGVRATVEVEGQATGR